MTNTSHKVVDATSSENFSSSGTVSFESSVYTSTAHTTQLKVSCSRQLLSP